MIKQLFTSILALCSCCLYVSAQVPFLTRDSLDINNLNAAVLVHGDMWWSADGNYHPQCFFPKGSQKNIAFASALWLSAFDNAGQMHVSAQTYRQDGNDYWPGPLDASDTLTYRDSYYWAKIWKVSRTDIQYFQSLSTHTSANTPQAILTWPGKGNSNAQGNAGSRLTITTDMAPFVDLNSNGIYEPLLGEYPDIKGDEALWWVFSDNGSSHSQTNGAPLKVEVHAMSYAYSRGTLIDNVVYTDFTIINRSSATYLNFRAGIHADIDLGYALDDFIGFDSSHRMGIQYNGINDDGGGAGHPANSYGTDPPIVGVSLVSTPGDAGATFVPAGSFTYYNNDFSIDGVPLSDTNCSNYMRSRLANGQHFTDDFTGAGAGSKGYGSGPDCNYVFTGDPSNVSEWSECSAGNNPGDRRFVLSANDYTLNSGSNTHFVIALVAVDSGGGCPYAGFSGIKTVADTAWEVYRNPLPPKPASVKNITRNNLITVYPNPAHNSLSIENMGTPGNASITIYNALGQVVKVETSNTQKSEVDISQLPVGLYNILYRNEDYQTTVKFTKE